MKPFDINSFSLKFSLFKVLSPSSDKGAWLILINRDAHGRASNFYNFSMVKGAYLGGSWLNIGI